jgi:putative hydrolase of the HAD superfamily
MDMIKAIIFDVGGTLLGAPDLFECISNLSRPSRYPKVEIRDRALEIFGAIVSGCRKGSPFISVADVIGLTLEKLFICPQDEIPKIAHDLYWDVFVTHSYPENNAVETLDALYNLGVELLISSDADAEPIYTQFEMHHMARYFSGYYISGDLKDYKPGDRMAGALKERIKQYDPLAVLFVGDSRVDIETGKKIGVRTVRIGPGGQNQFAEDYSISDLSELLPIVLESTTGS